MFLPDNVNKYVNLDFSSCFKVDNATNLYVRPFIGDSLPHAHNFFELTYVTHGTVAHSVNFTHPEIMRKGDFILIDIGSVHEFAGIDKNTTCETLTLAFTGSFVSEKIGSNPRLRDVFHCDRLNLPSTYAITPSGVILHDLNGLIHDSIMLISKLIELGDDCSESALKNLLVSLLITIATLPQKNINRAISVTTAILINHIENRYNEQSLLNHVADDLQYSISHLSNKFRWEVGMSFNDYLKKHRIEVAKRLINTTDMKVTEIASSVGYTDHKYFSRVFKSTTNMTPQQYRRTIAKHLVKGRIMLEPIETEQESGQQETQQSNPTLKTQQKEPKQAKSQKTKTKKTNSKSRKSKQ